MCVVCLCPYCVHVRCIQIHTVRTHERSRTTNRQDLIEVLGRGTDAERTTLGERYLRTERPGTDSREQAQAPVNFSP